MSKLRNNDVETRVTSREVATYKRKFAARVVRKIGGRNYLDDAKAKLEDRFHTIRAVHNTMNTHDDLIFITVLVEYNAAITSRL